ncbi:MAG: tetratricopeptide repeat protein, partial [Cyanobacteria bacterium P01_D01_bin.105]
PDRLSELELLTLSRLSEADVAALSTAILGEVGKQPDLLDLLQRETEGNTFFVVEVIRALAEEAGQLAAIGRSELPENLIPDGIQTIVTQRLDRLPQNARELLSQAALTGRQLDLAVVEKLGPGIDVLNWWLPLCAEAAILEISDNQWHFSHDKIRIGILARLSAKTTQTCHENIALALADLYGEDVNYAAQLAFHWGEAGNEDQERHYSVLAGRHAIAQFAYDEALNLLNRALALTVEANLVSLYEIHLMREQIYNVQGNRDKQVEELEKISQLAITIGDENRRLDVILREMAFAAVVGKYEEVVEKAQEAVKMSAELGVDTRTVTGYLMWGESLSTQAQHETARTILQKGLDLGRQIGDVNNEVAILRVLSIVSIENAAYEQAREYGEEGLTLARKINNRWEEGELLKVLGMLEARLVEYVKAAELFDASLAVKKREVGDRLGELNIIRNLMVLELLRSYQRSYELTKEYVFEGLATSREIDDKQSEGAILNGMALLCMYYGQFVEADSYLLEGLRISEEINYPLMSVILLNNLGISAAYQDRLDDARAYYQKALSLVQELDLPREKSDVLYYFGLLEQSQGNIDIARDYFQQALEICKEMQLHLAIQSQAALAWIAASLGESAEPYLTDSMNYWSENPQLDGIEFLGKVYLNLYGALQKTGDPRAKDLLSHAHQFLQNVADSLEDEGIRESFLENITEHQEILRLAEMASKHDESIAPPVPIGSVLNESETDTTLMINNRYVLHEEIGRGGMGIVFKVTDRLTRDVVALKQVAVAGAEFDKAYRQSLTHEFQILAGLRHPNIISVLDYGFGEDRRPFFTMSWLREPKTILEAGQDA